MITLNQIAKREKKMDSLKRISFEMKMPKSIYIRANTNI